MKDILLVEGDNELSVEMVPVGAEADLAGFVYDTDTSKLIPGVTVTIDGKTTTSDYKGIYAFEHLIPGSYTLRFSKEGYQEDYVRDIVLTEGHNIICGYLTLILPALYGVVADAETGYPIQEVKVDIDGLAIFTSASGEYRLERVYPGEYTLTFARYGYETLTMSIIVLEADIQLDVEMAPRLLEVFPIQVVDLDLNEDGIVDGKDETAFLAAYGSVEGDLNYDRRLDANFDGVIDDKDYDIFYGTLGKNLNVIRDSIKTGIYEHLVWPNGWDAYLVALNKDKVEEFAGHGNLIQGWISIQHHSYIFESKYVCFHFAVDTALAAYKGLGYGYLLYAKSPKHAYNMLWVGGDWHDLNNWYILEPQHGKVFSHPAGSEDLPSEYHTEDIGFWHYTETVADGRKRFHIYRLSVDYETKRVSFGEVSTPGGSIYSVHGEGFEEPAPDVFDRAYLVGV